MKKSLMKKQDLRNFMGKYGIGIVLLLMMIIISIMESTFLSSDNLVNVANQVSINAMISFGVCLAITTGGIDLSVGAQIALVSCVLGQLIEKMQMGIFPAILIALAVSSLFGLLNGFLIAKFNMFPFVVTLSTQLIIRGLAQVLSSGQAVSITDPVFKRIYASSLGPIPFPILVLIIVFVFMYLLIHWTKLGRYILAVGDNENAAIASGVSSAKVKMLVYSISGFLAAIAGILLTAKTSSAQANVGIAYETDAIAACVLGGTSFNGGITTAPGVLMGIFIIGFIYNGMNLVGIGSYYQSITKGIIIIAAVLLDMKLNKKDR